MINIISVFYNITTYCLLSFNASCNLFLELHQYYKENDPLFWGALVGPAISAGSHLVRKIGRRRRRRRRRRRGGKDQISETQI